MMIRLLSKSDAHQVQQLMRNYEGDWISDTNYVLDYIDNHDFWAIGNFENEKLASFILARDIPEQKFAVLHLFFADPYLTVYQHKIHQVYDVVLRYLQSRKIYRYYTVLKQEEADRHRATWSMLSKERFKYDVYLEDSIPAYEFSIYNQYQNNMLNGKLKSNLSEIYQYVLREEFRE